MAFLVRTAQFPISSIRLHPHRRLSTSRRSISTLPRASICTSSSLDHASIIGDDGARSMPKVLLKGMDFPELEDSILKAEQPITFTIAFLNPDTSNSSNALPSKRKWVQSHGFRSGQALMLWKRLYGDNIWAHCTDELTGLNKDFRKMLAVNATFKALSVKDVIKASDGTRKILFSLEDGMVIETVVIPTSGGRTTVCVSSQVGCAMNCQFCYTGRMGLKKNLTVAEIVEQAVFARRLLSSDVGSITNVVFMGMGEPFHNIDNVMKAASVMVDEKGLHFSPRKVTVSTSGLVPQMKRFLRESNCALAVSLNATTDEVRNWIMPINRKYNLKLLLDTLKEELHSKNRYKVLFEYVMLEGINDSMDDAKRLVDLVEGIPCKINLISFNRHKGSLFKPSSNEKMVEFRNFLAEAGCVVLLRPSRGDDQMAACGQLGEPGNFQAPLLRVPARFQAVE